MRSVVQPRSSKALDEAALAVKELCHALSAQRLPGSLMAKLEEMVACIGDREYVNANKAL